MSLHPVAGCDPESAKLTGSQAKLDFAEQAITYAFPPQAHIMVRSLQSQAAKDQAQFFLHTAR